MHNDKPTTGRENLLNTDFKGAPFFLLHYLGIERSEFPQTQNERLLPPRDKACKSIYAVFLLLRQPCNLNLKGWCSRQQTVKGSHGFFHWGLGYSFLMVLRETQKQRKKGSACKWRLKVGTLCFQHHHSYLRLVCREANDQRLNNIKNRVF